MTNAAALDAVLKCKDCGRDYLLTAGEREWFLVRGLQLPARCKECRAARREVRKTATYDAATAMNETH